MMANIEYPKLLTYSSDKSLFRQELINLMKSLDQEQRFDLFTHCYKEYSDIFPDVLIEVFYLNNINSLPVKT